MTLVSVITPTWQRHGALLDRCIPSVQAQTCSDLEHIIVSDGPDPELKRKLAGLPVRYSHLRRHRGSWGGPGRRHGAALATGEFIAYLDDDDAYRPGHVANLVWALQVTPVAGFAYSHMVVHMPTGAMLRFPGPPGVMMGTPMIMHRRELLDIATWGKGLHEDTTLVHAWLNAGVQFTEVTMTTVDVYPGPATTAAITGSLAFGSLEWE